MKRHLKLIIDEDLLRAARKVARQRNTSVNQLVCDYLAGLASQTRKIRMIRMRIGPITWTHDDSPED